MPSRKKKDGILHCNWCCLSERYSAIARVVDIVLWLVPSVSVPFNSLRCHLSRLLSKTDDGLLAYQLRPSVEEEMVIGELPYFHWDIQTVVDDFVCFIGEFL